MHVAAQGVMFVSSAMEIKPSSMGTSIPASDAGADTKASFSPLPPCLALPDLGCRDSVTALPTLARPAGSLLFACCGALKKKSYACAQRLDRQRLSVPGLLVGCTPVMQARI